MAVPVPTPIYRIVHLDNLPIYLQRSGMHAPNYWPDDGLVWKVKFLVHRFCPWELVDRIGVIDEERRKQVEDLLAEHDPAHKPVVKIHRDWYY